MTPRLNLFDENLDASAIESQDMLPVRLVLVVALGALAVFALGWPLAMAWMGGVVFTEIWTRIGAVRAVRGITMGPVYGVIYLSGASLMPYAYAALGLLLWRSGRPAYEVAAVGMWAGQLLYAQNFCARSRSLLIAVGVPSILMPLAVPMILRRFEGLDQIVVMVMVTLCVCHAISAALINLRSARRLADTAHDLIDAKATAEAANIAKSNFLATMSHEIRTPLNGVLGMAQAMDADELSPIQRERLDVVRHSGESLLTILNDILDLSKIEAGKLEIEQIDFDLEEVIAAARTTFSAVAERKALGFVFEIEAAKGIYSGDPTRLRQIVSNLVSNALKFTEVGEVRLTASRSSDGLCIVVADTGLGISPEGLVTLFSKFTQADASIARHFGGSGLGLAICRDLADLMGGTIEVESTLGKGSRFIVTFPMAYVRKANHPPVVDAVAADAVMDIRLLAAEDNAINRLVLKTLLEQVGVDPVIVENGALAVEAWETGDWDIILMDVQMPSMDGPTATRLIRQREAATGRRRTPIVALTANAMSNQVDDYLQAGMDAHVSKPIEAHRLYEALAALLNDAAAEIAAEITDEAAA
jgi:signal transduction histidine kinase/ActR/RegA family two-component response regulator